MYIFILIAFISLPHAYRSFVVSNGFKYHSMFPRSLVGPLTPNVTGGQCCSNLRTFSLLIFSQLAAFFSQLSGALSDSQPVTKASRTDKNINNDAQNSRVFNNVSSPPNKTWPQWDWDKMGIGTFLSFMLLFLCSGVDALGCDALRRRCFAFQNECCEDEQQYPG